MNDAPDIPKTRDESTTPSRRKQDDNTNSRRSGDASRSNRQIPRGGDVRDLHTDFGNGIADFVLQQQYESRQNALEQKNEICKQKNSIQTLANRNLNAFYDRKKTNITGDGESGPGLTMLGIRNFIINRGMSHSKIKTAELIKNADFKTFRHGTQLLGS